MVRLPRDCSFIQSAKEFTQANQECASAPPQPRPRLDA
ncbi:hypothetical protein FM114_00675 [Luteococcus japonicus LSP_Lj1]|uniref:Uncharacterized protein n=1 Tax=Luteococcus japonicus LSP_Lj1 TaxID=1255658 RepID=A0A1R4IA61_9ACTN|nr:hypothetical protein FM114_00675 [Luteococcus japonicus LSP_Lj1]